MREHSSAIALNRPAILAGIPPVFIGSGRAVVAAILAAAALAVTLLQPVMSICRAALLVGEAITWTTAIGAVTVILLAGAAVRVRLKPVS